MKKVLSVLVIMMSVLTVNAQTSKDFYNYQDKT